MESSPCAPNNGIFMCRHTVPSHRDSGPLNWLLLPLSPSIFLSVIIWLLFLFSPLALQMYPVETSNWENILLVCFPVRSLRAGTMFYILLHIRYEVQYMKHGKRCWKFIKFTYFVLNCGQQKHSVPMWRQYSRFFPYRHHMCGFWVSGAMQTLLEATRHWGLEMWFTCPCTPTQHIAQLSAPNMAYSNNSPNWVMKMSFHSSHPNYNDLNLEFSEKEKYYLSWVKCYK